ncbi:hypothetical protein I79_023395 [Cricetulus griseus]|uniref:Transient receptor potential cation channel, subfamily M, member 3 isoform e n=1 Tax=Cricetulus griseus TaxID=10029 RepID=G3IHT9_CRIGR|nr:hypothetical protein I79_023395 [Cricetulus griseus]ERE79250.1 transient receptor potential cation channel, subfamily M, member 3 isoform e [Cricetulus griseus]
MERGCSDREDSAESRRRSRSASRGRFAESWKRLSSKQGSTKRSGLPSQQTPLEQGLLTCLLSVCAGMGRVLDRRGADENDFVGEANFFCGVPHLLLCGVRPDIGIAHAILSTVIPHKLAVL